MAAEHHDRFIPSQKLFRETVLVYDFFKDIVDDQKLEKTFTSVPLHFESEQHYLDVFRPLFYQEVKMQIFRDKMHEMERVTEQVELVKFDQIDGFLKLQVQRLQKTEVRYMTNDLVVLTDKTNPHQETDVHFLAMVTDDPQFDIVYLWAKLDMSQGQEGSRTWKVIQAIKNRDLWRMGRICGLATVIREYEGLMSLPHIPLRSLLVNRLEQKAQAEEMQAAPAVPGLNEDGGLGGDATGPKAVAEDARQLEIPKKLEAALEAKCNPSQLNAILDSRKVSGITLVQGPPGTGKTTTILGILAMLLNARATTSTAVSYTRTGKNRQKDPNANSDSSTSEDEQDSEAAIQERQRERLNRMRGRMPWLRAGYVPWADSIEQELSGPNNKRLRVPYTKLRQQDVVPMSEIKEDATPQKVLVSAPSNAAIDEVMRRAIGEGIAGADGTLQKPSMVRLGPNVHPTLLEHSLENIARKKATETTETPTKAAFEVMKARLMREKRVLCTTLSVSGSRDMVGFQGDFDTVVIDEASQGVEMSTLVPIKLGCKRLILVGDPQQLPATVFSTIAMEHKYDQSLFQRLQASGHKVNLLNMQFRMHPAISSFPSNRFYDGKVVNGRELEEFEQKFPAPWSRIPCYGPIVFFHLKGEQEREGISFVNETEADFVVQLFASVSRSFPPQDAWRDKVAVISPYAEQVKLIRQKFKILYGIGDKSTPCPVDVNTVDGFQGREKDTVIVSTVRANTESKSIGFVQDKRRMNVACTRARKNLWVVGRADVLKVNPDWKAFILEQERATRLLRVSPPFDDFLARYLDRWFARHPDEIRLDGIATKAPVGDADVVDKDAEDMDFTVSPEELEELRRKEEEEELGRQRDVEEVDSDFEEVEPSFTEKNAGSAEGMSVDQEGLENGDQQAVGNEIAMEEGDGNQDDE
mmetsp:Transcript_103475/g.179644  ORF Transcript_103475/g.179644 Transcript_103475/m.179644 type:complete len:923 (+) Transcript_103475:47-2815(+)